jgi:hypothetical protein
VDMVFADKVSEQDQAIVILEELPGVQQNLHSVGAGKDGEPANDRTRQEMGEGVFSEPIACASHETWLNQGGDAHASDCHGRPARVTRHPFGDLGDPAR